MTLYLRWEPDSASWQERAGGELPIAVADSWLVDEGRVRALGLHLDRFRGSCAELDADDSQLVAALEALYAAIPAEGRWFPRVELGVDRSLMLTLRPAPPAENEVVAWLSPLPDTRSLPRRKGPELVQLGELRKQAAEHGAGEAVLRDAEGRLLEGAYSSLLWWEGETLCAVPDAAPVLPGITRQLLLEMAADDGVDQRYMLPQRQQLEGREVWLVGSLHGIRVVSEWVDDALTAGAPKRAPAWQQRLAQLQG